MFRSVVNNVTLSSRGLVPAGTPTGVSRLQWTSGTTLTFGAVGLLVGLALRQRMLQREWSQLTSALPIPLSILAVLELRAWSQDEIACEIWDQSTEDERANLVYNLPFLAALSDRLIASNGVSFRDIPEELWLRRIGFMGGGLFGTFSSRDRLSIYAAACRENAPLARRPSFIAFCMLVSLRADSHREEIREIAKYAIRERQRESAGTFYQALSYLTPQELRDAQAVINGYAQQELEEVRQLPETGGRNMLLYLRFADHTVWQPLLDDEVEAYKLSIMLGPAVNFQTEAPGLNQAVGRFCGYLAQLSELAAPLRQDSTDRFAMQQRFNELDLQRRTGQLDEREWEDFKERLWEVLFAKDDIIGTDPYARAWRRMSRAKWFQWLSEATSAATYEELARSSLDDPRDREQAISLWRDRELVVIMRPSILDFLFDRIEPARWLEGIIEGKGRALFGRQLRNTLQKRGVDACQWLSEALSPSQHNKLGGGRELSDTPLAISTIFQSVVRNLSATDIDSFRQTCVALFNRSVEPLTWKACLERDFQLTLPPGTDFEGFYRLCRQVVNSEHLARVLHPVLPEPVLRVFAMRHQNLWYLPDVEIDAIEFDDYEIPDHEATLQWSLLTDWASRDISSRLTPLLLWMRELSAEQAAFSALDRVASLLRDIPNFQESIAALNMALRAGLPGPIAGRIWRRLHVLGVPGRADVLREGIDEEFRVHLVNEV